MLLLCGCDRDSRYFGNTAPPSRQILVFDNGGELSSPDPPLGEEASDTNVIAALFEGLVQNNPLTAQPMAALATHYEVSADSRLYIFYLRGHPHPSGIRLADSDSLPFEYTHGVHPPPDSVPALWSDGTTITAHDFVYSWRRAIDPRTAAQLADYLTIIRNGKDISQGKRPTRDLAVSAPDDFTFRVDLAEPAPYFLSLIVSPMFRAVPRHVVEKARLAGRESLWLKPGTIATSGPFVLTEWRPYDFVRVRRSATYYQANMVRLEEIVFVPVGADAAIINLYRAGHVHAMDTGLLPESLMPALRSRSDLRSSELSGFRAYAINLSKPPFDNVLLRYALNMSLDKAVISSYLNDTPARTLMPPIGGYSGPESVHVPVQERDYDVLQYDPRAARKLLALAGYPNGAGADGKQLTFELHIDTGTRDLNVGQIMANQWLRNLNIRARLIPAEFHVKDADLHSGNYSGLAEDDWVADYTDPMGLLMPTVIFYGSGGWTDSQYLSLLGEANRTYDRKTRFEKLAIVEARVMHEMPVIPLAFDHAHYLSKPYVHALDADALDGHAFRYTWIDTGWKP